MIEGFVDVIRPFQVRGWAYDPNSPQSRLTVTLVIAGEEIVAEPASLFRQDLSDSGIGDGHHAFVFNIDRKLPVEAPQQIEVYGRSADGECQTLPQAEHAVLDHAVAPVARPAELSPIKGYFSVKAGTVVTGWAFYPGRPDEHLSVELMVGGRTIVSGIANVFRPDLVLAFVGNGDHGFLLEGVADFPADRYAEIEVVARSATGICGPLRPVDGTPTAEHSSQIRALNLAPQLVEPTVSFRGPTSDRTQHPLFILGAARSGTSAIAQALVSATRYAGQEEGHLLDLIAPMLQVVARHYEERSEEWTKQANTMISSVPRQYIEEGIRHTFVELARSLFPRGWWLDKTPRPSMIVAAPLLRQIWPEARFVFMKRRAIENILSRTKKFPGVAFAEHCRDWTMSMQSWAAVRERLLGVAIEIEQLFLATQPHQAAATLAPMLLLEPEEVDALARSLAVDRPERTADQFGAVTPLSMLGWAGEEVDMFHRICGPMMDAYGYGTEVEYFSAGREDQAIVNL